MNIEKEFDENFGDKFPFISDTEIKEIKKFINDKIKEEREKGVADGIAIAKRGCKKKIKEIIESVPIEEKCEFDEGMGETYIRRKLIKEWKNNQLKKLK